MSSVLKKISLISSLCFATSYGFSQDSIPTHPVITGHTNVEHIENSSEHNWFSKNYSDYVYDSTSINALHNIKSNYSIVVVAGTWCPDTHKELPKFYKVIDDSGIPRDKVKLLFVDRELKSPDMTSKKYKIKHIPTFIVFAGDKEKGRIVIHPQASIEKDLLKIIKTK